MVAKLVVHGADRAEAIDRMRAALAGYVIEGIHTNLGMHARIMADEAFQAGDLSTTFLRERLGLKA